MLYNEISKHLEVVARILVIMYYQMFAHQTMKLLSKDVQMVDQKDVICPTNIWKCCTCNRFSIVYNNTKQISNVYLQQKKILTTYSVK